MNHDEYEQLGQLLLKLKLSEQERLDKNKGSLYLQFVQDEVFDPIERVLDLAQTRAKQTGGV